MSNKQINQGRNTISLQFHKIHYVPSNSARTKTKYINATFKHINYND